MSGARSSRSDAENLEAHDPADALLRSILTSRRLQPQPSVVHGREACGQHTVDPIMPPATLKKYLQPIVQQTHRIRIIVHQNRLKKSQHAQNYRQLSVRCTPAMKPVFAKSLKDTVYAVNTLVFRRSDPGQCAFIPRGTREGPPEACWRN